MLDQVLYLVLASPLWGLDRDLTSVDFEQVGCLVESKLIQMVHVPVVASGRGSISSQNKLLARATFIKLLEASCVDDIGARYDVWRRDVLHV